MPEKHASAGWGDAATICPWQIYMTYGNKEILEEQFDCMKKWVNYITDVTEEPYLWIGGQHFGDWLGLDAAPGSYKGATRDDFVATAFYAYSTKLVIKAGHVIGRSITEYEKLYSEIVKAFRKKFSEYTTQTECVLAVWFELAEEPEKVVAQLAEMVKNAGNQLQTGFLGTPYLLFVLSKYGYTELAYTLLLRREYPSWLYPVGKGATTIWEHWDGIQENGEFWDPYMNSFNHYAYGSVAGWVYEQAAGIQPIEEAPGFKKVLIEPHPDSRLKWLMASMDTRHGKVSSRWEWHGNKICYQIESSVEAEVRIGTRSIHVKPGKYIFWE